MIPIPSTIRVILAVMRREWWINTRAYRVSFFLAMGLASLFTLLIGYFLYHEVFDRQVTSDFIAYAGTDDYVTYIAIGLIVYTFAIRMLYPVRDFLAEQWEGTLPVVTMMGMPRLPFHFGCMLFSTLYAAVEVSVLAAIAWAFLGVELSGINWAGAAVSAAAAFVGLFGFSLTLASAILAVRDRMVVEGAAFALMALLSGVSFPTDYLPGSLQTLAEAVPLTHALRALRAAALEHAGPAEIATPLLALAVLGIVYLVLGIAVLDKAIRRSVEQTA